MTSSPDNPQPTEIPSDDAPPKRLRFSELKIGQIYRIRWVGHYGHVERTTGYLGCFQGLRPIQCEKHGDYIGDEAVFRRLKGPKRRKTITFGVVESDTIITKEANNA